MKTKNPLRKLTLLKTTIAHLENEQMTAARGGSCGGTWLTDGCTVKNNGFPVTDISC